MSQQFKSGDKVEWSSGKGTSTGKVKEKITESKTVEGNSVSATKEDPRYLVENENTGNISGHKPESLKKVNSSSSDSSDSDSEREEKIEEFDEAVNMTAKQIKDWLETDESQSVGQKDGSGNIKGRESGKHIIKILDKNKSDYTEDDFQRMKKVVAYVHRHLAQKPSGDVKNSDWRYSLMNWGHDPCK